MQTYPTLELLQLAFQSLGVVFGDLGTSPLYVFYNIFPRKIEDTEQIIGALSLIIYSLTLIPLIKYVFIVLRANDNGQGISCILASLKFLLQLWKNVIFLVCSEDAVKPNYIVFSKNGIQSCFVLYSSDMSIYIYISNFSQFLPKKRSKNLHKWLAFTLRPSKLLQLLVQKNCSSIIVIQFSLCAYLLNFLFTISYAFWSLSWFMQCDTTII